MAQSGAEKSIHHTQAVVYVLTESPAGTAVNSAAASAPASASTGGAPVWTALGGGHWADVHIFQENDDYRVVGWVPSTKNSKPGLAV